MPVMTYKNGFEPKDARTVHSYDQDDDFDDFDDWSLESTPPRPRRQRKTGTQALVEFLNTTSPEEFQKTPPPTGPTKRRSTRFFLRRLNKNKSSSSSTASSTPSSTSGGSSSASLYQQGVPHTIHRKNYIEIVTGHPTRLPHYYDPVTQGGVSVGVGVGAGAGVGHPFQALTSASKISLNEPILPTRRESSLHAPSIRSLSIHRSPTYPTTPSTATKINAPATINTSFSSSGITTSTAATSPTTPGVPASALKLPKMSTTTNDDDSSDIRNGDDDGKNANDDGGDKKRNIVDALVATCDGMDVIEAGLIQRLKQCQLSGVDTPMDMMTAKLTEEHIRALKVSAAAAASDHEQQHGPKTKKGRTRHAQVQTLDRPCDDTEEEKKRAQQAAAATATAKATSKSNAQTVEELQLELAQERQERQRLAAALETTSDHFEVLSGLAYKKLRELWEEKLRWENACIELNGKLMMAEKNDGGKDHGNDDMNDAWTEDYQQSDYIVG
ncbi:hypothetical protein BCR42DRAFT_491234 [Absidia repens]|uniref:Uncharacterized protein n=1 Tax=Absidia repens TaxID=90262 RepID=A0A1X2IJ08_9FUNG|nr:hypothetical protein BCR42DRAFT_491234 [Absidia repens]